MTSDEAVRKAVNGDDVRGKVGTNGIIVCESMSLREVFGLNKAKGFIGFVNGFIQDEEEDTEEDEEDDEEDDKQEDEEEDVEDDVESEEEDDTEEEFGERADNSSATLFRRSAHVETEREKDDPVEA